MVEKLKRVTSEADSHKVLDIAYLFAAIIGLFQFIECMRAVEAGYTGFSITLLSIQMLLLSLCGSIAYVTHIRGKLYWEFAMAAPIATGLLTAIGGSVIILLNGEARLNPFAVTMGGASIALGIFFVIEIAERVYKIDRRIKQLRISKIERTEAEQSLTPYFVLNKARGILNKER